MMSKLKYSLESKSRQIVGVPKAWVMAFLLLFGAISMPCNFYQVKATPVIIDEDSFGSWEDTFTDTDGIEIWDNLELTDEGLRLTDIFEDNFTGIDGSLPDQRRWFIIDDGQKLEILNNYLRTEINTVGSPTWGIEKVRTRDDFSGYHVLTWRQNLLKPSAGAVYNFFILNASDNSPILGINQNNAGQYWVVNYVGGGNLNMGGPYNGWVDHKIIYDNGFVEFYLDGGWKYSYTFNVDSVKYEFGAHEQNCDARIFTDYVLITSNITTGNVTSTEIQLPAGQSWDTLTLNKYEDVPGNYINVSILDGATYTLISGYENLTATDIDISGIDISIYPSIRLRAHFSGNGSSTPILRSWKVSWIDNIPPAPPTGLAVTNPWTGYSLLLSWNPNSEPDVRTYSVYRSTDNISFSWIGDVTKDKLYFDDIGLTAGVKYYYKIKALDEVPNQSPYSEVAEGIPDTDMDGDRIGDTVDPDRDGDTVLNPIDDFPDNENEWLDSDGDGIGNNADLDDDDDGVNDTNDAFPLDPNEWRDYDGDGTGDEADLDDDNDGIPDISDPYPLNPLNDMEITIDFINATVNNIQSDLDKLNITELVNILNYINQTLPIKFNDLSTQLSNVENNLTIELGDINLSLSADIQNLLVSITNDIIDLNTSLSDQLLNLLITMTNDHQALEDWLDIVLSQIDTNLTVTKNTLSNQLSDFETYVTDFNNNLQNDVDDISYNLQMHDIETGQNHTTIIDMLENIRSIKLQDMKTMLIDLAGNLSVHNQSIANDILGVVNDIEEFEENSSNKLEEIDNTLDDLQKLEDILDDLEELDDEVETVQEEEKETQEKIDFVDLLLIILVILLFVNIILTLVVGRGKKASAPPSQGPQDVSFQREKYAPPTTQTNEPLETYKKEEPIEEKREEQEFPPHPPSP